MVYRIHVPRLPTLLNVQTKVHSAVNGSTSAEAEAEAEAETKTSPSFTCPEPPAAAGRSWAGCCGLWPSQEDGFGQAVTSRQPVRARGTKAHRLVPCTGDSGKQTRKNPEWSISSTRGVRWTWIMSDSGRTGVTRGREEQLSRFICSTQRKNNLFLVG